MVRPIKKRRTRSKNSSSSLKNILFALLVLGAAAVGFFLVQHRQDLFQRASGPTSFLETFDGSPTTPQPWNPANWDIQVHSRDDSTWYTLEEMEAHHGPDCSAPIDANGNLVTHHEMGSYQDAVFKCKDHVMTSINAGGYGVIYLTPPALADFSNGTATINFDITTWRSSSRDWWDVWITPYNENMALPLEDFLPDLDGPPKDAVRFGMGQGTICPEVFHNFQGTLPDQYSNGCQWWVKYDDEGIKQSPLVRTTFQIQISRTHLKVGIPSINLWWFDKDIPDLGFQSGIVQFGHHSYNPTKDCNVANPAGPDGKCLPNTWHWDNISINPSLPFTIIRADKRFVDTDNQSVTFNQPAPANAFLRFAARGANLNVSYDNGKTWVIPARQAAEKPDSQSYWTPIPQGTQNVMYKKVSLSPDWWPNGWMAQDFAIWALEAPVTTDTPAPDSLTVTPTPIPNATSTPVPTATPTPKPTNTPTPRPTNTPTPTPTSIPTTGGTNNGLSAKYYNNKNFSSIVMQRVDPTVNFTWGYGAPLSSMGKDTFSVEWNGFLDAPSDDTYTIFTNSDDGTRVYLDNILIINDWYDHGTQEFRNSIHLTPGLHTLKVQYYENKGYSKMQLLWKSSTIPKQIIPSTNLRTQ